MRAYVNAKDGLYIRSEPKIDPKNIKGALVYGAAVDVDRVLKNEWSRILTAPEPRYVYGSFLSQQPPNEVFHSPLSASRINLHASAGGWSPDDRECAIVRANNVNAVLICTYNPNVASQMIERFRTVGVEQFVLRATSPYIPKVINGDVVLAAKLWAREAVVRLKPFVSAIGGRSVMVQLHNEPNLSDEGLYTGWRTAKEFNTWFITAASVLRDAVSGIKIGFSPMSPGFAIPSRRIDENQFIAACYGAVSNSDWIAVHNYYGASDASDLTIPLTKWRGFAQNKPIVCTESGPSIGKYVTISGCLRMFKMFSAANIPTFGWILSATGAADFIGQGWKEQNIILPSFNRF